LSYEPLSRQRALVIGGTGPTGPFVVEGLHERGYEVTILHGGQHEYEFAVPGVRHVHEDPHFEEPLRRGLGEETYELVVAQYGRLRVIAEVLAGRTGRLVAVGGATGIFASDEDPRWGATRKPALFPDTSSCYVDDPGEDGANKLGFRMVEAMNALFERHPGSTYVGYPVNYGPRNPGPYDWSVIRRVLEGRRTFAIADDGLKIDSRVFTENAAAAVLLVVDNPEIAAGKRYSVTDENAFTMRQRIEFIARHLGGELELVDMPYDVAWPCHPMWRHHRGHRLATSTLIREELGYRDAVPPDAAMAATIDWIVANRPEPDGELERQIGDPFDYAREDELVERWRASVESLGAIESPLPVQGHQYRHPKKPGEAWSAGSAAR
jgi:nucleoside-diphosphate-sugar epimerase